MQKTGSIRAPLVLALTISFAGSSWACIFDTDCQLGSECLKSRGQIYGICASGLFPWNRKDNQRVYAPLDLDRSYGNACSFDRDCGINKRCFKAAGNINGVCFGR